MKIGKAIKAEMKKKHISVAEMADRVGVTRMSMNNWLHSKGLSFNRIKSIARELDMTVSELVKKAEGMES